MFSGGDSNEGLNKFNSYEFVNQAAVSSAVAAGQNIDWAQLAQQWIQMRDNTESNTITAPPPPDISYVKNAKSSNFMEQGEADMEMDDEDQVDKSFHKMDNANHADGVIQQRNINQPWMATHQAANLNNTGLQSDTSKWNIWPMRDCSTQSQNQPTSSNRSVNPTAHIPSLLKITVPHPNEIRAMSDVPNQQDNCSTMMDAVKRKGLPAWIRDGLEKMEREKQKQMEMRQNKDNAWYSSEDETDQVKKSPNNIMVKSLSTNSDTCANYHDESTDNETTGESSSNQKISIKTSDENLEFDEGATNKPGKTYEQKLADLMIVVRRTLTELLLEVTNEEISKVADETLKSFKSKASSVQVIRKSALSTITGKLGLAVYGDSSSDENSDDDDEHASSKQDFQSESDNDSEEEIKNTIRSKRRAFGKISEEIEECVASAASREEEKLKFFIHREEEEREIKHKKYDRLQSSDPTCSGYSGHSIGKGYERDFGETSETKLQHLNGKRQKDRGARKERTTRFSDNKDNKYVALAATATFISNLNATSAGNAGSSNVTLAQSSNTQHHNIPDVNGLLTNCTNAGMTSVLNAADAALEKALKRKPSHSPRKNDRRRTQDCDRTSSKKRTRRENSKESRSRSLSGSATTSSSSSSTSSSSSDSETSTSRSSHNSKYNHRSTTKRKSHRTSSSKSEQSPRDRRDKRSDDHKYSSSSSHLKRNRESSSSRYHQRRVSTDSEDEYSRRKYDSHYSRNSSHSRTHTLSSSRRDRDNSRSRSRSSYSSSSNRRH